MMTIKDMTARIAMAVMALMAWMPCAMAQEASAPAIGISVKPVTPTKGSSFTVAVTLSNDVPVYGLQLTVALPDGLEMQTAEPGISVTDRTDGFAVTANGGKIVLYADDNKKVIAEGEGAILTLPVSVVDGFEGGNIGINGALASVAGTAGGYVAVSVKDVTAPIPVLPTSITISGAPESGTIDVGKSLALTATLTPEYATETAVTWSSNNAEVATVEADGTVTAVAPGTAEITATAGNVSASCSLTVLLPATDIKLAWPKLEMKYGDNAFPLGATVYPSGCTDKIVWSSSNESVAKVGMVVNNDGFVTAVAPGTATITATAGSVSASCVVTVNPVIEFDYTGGLSLDAGGSLDLKDRVKVSPETDDITIVRKSLKPDWLKMSDEGVLTLAEGAFTCDVSVDVDITAYGYTVSKSLTVKVKATTEIAVAPEVLTLGTGFGKQLTATLTPAASADKVGWSSNNAEVATVDAAGLVTAVAEGTATITATAGGVSATCEVTVMQTKITIGVAGEGYLAALAIGETVKLDVTVSPEPDPMPEIGWISSDKNVAEVKADGTITAVGPGEATITVRVGNQSATCEVTVKEDPKLTLDRTELTVAVGGTATLTASLTPADFSDEIIWSSSDAAVATVDKGEVTAVSPGTAIVTATAKNHSELTASCTITVPAVPATGVTLDRTALALTYGDSPVKLTATVNPANSTDALVWRSSDENVVTVDTDGTVTIAGVGEAIVTATAGSASASCAVEVKALITLKGPAASLEIGDKSRCELTISPQPADGTAIVWISSDTEVAEVDQEGNVTAVAPGTAIITVTVGTRSVSVTVTVNEPPTYPATGVTLDRTALALTYGDSPVKLTATVDPANSTDALVWRSSDENVVTVDTDGTVTIAGVGEATVTATAGSASASCAVEVKALITLKGPAEALEIGDKFRCELTISPQPADGIAIVWISSDAAVAEVDQEGNVTAVAPGTAIITVTVGTRTVSVTVTVNEPPTYPATGVTLDRTALALTYGDSPVKLTATVDPANSTDALVWRSSDENVVTVDYDGTVTIVGVGTATITATAGSESATCEVTVKALITLKGPDSALEIGDEYKCELTISPQPAAGTAILWSSSHPEVAGVDQEGTVTAVAPGTATITVTVGTQSVSATVTVNEPPTYPATGVTLDRTALALTYGDSQVKLTATVEPVYSTDVLVWRSSNSEVATVDADGTVTIAGVGTATITATAGSASASCAVEVKALITLKGPAAALEIGEEYKCELTISPQPAAGTAIVWSSSNPEVAGVDQEGNVTAVGPGTATITVTVGTQSVSVTVTVNEPPTGINGVEAVGERGDLYNLRGDIVAREVIISELSSLPRGVYIFKTATRSVKIRL